MQDSHIAWTDHTHNPWIGCTKVSPACKHCYAEALSLKYGYVPGWGPGQPRKQTNPANWDLPLKWDKAAKRKGKRARVFCASLADVFDPEASSSLRRDLFELIELTPNLDWLVLTKRVQFIQRQLEAIGYWSQMPMPNLWLGVTAENQKWFDKRWPVLRDTPAKVRFLSCEPLLGPIVLPEDAKGKLHWVICGGETTPQRDVARAMNPEWARSLRDQCAAMGIPFFFKQWGNRIPRADGSQPWIGKTAKYYKEHHDLLDGVHHHAFPVTK